MSTTRRLFLLLGALALVAQAAPAFGAKKPQSGDMPFFPVFDPADNPTDLEDSVAAVRYGTRAWSIRQATREKDAPANAGAAKTAAAQLAAGPDLYSDPLFVFKQHERLAGDDPSWPAVLRNPEKDSKTGGWSAWITLCLDSCEYDNQCKRAVLLAHPQLSTKLQKSEEDIVLQRRRVTEVVVVFRSGKNENPLGWGQSVHIDQEKEVDVRVQFGEQAFTDFCALAACPKGVRATILYKVKGVKRWEATQTTEVSTEIVKSLGEVIASLNLKEDQPIFSDGRRRICEKIRIGFTQKIKAHRRAADLIKLFQTRINVPDLLFMEHSLKDVTDKTTADEIRKEYIRQRRAEYATSRAQKRGSGTAAETEHGDASRHTDSTSVEVGGGFGVGPFSAKGSLQHGSTDTKDQYQRGTQRQEQMNGDSASQATAGDAFVPHDLRYYTLRSGQGNIAWQEELSATVFDDLDPKYINGPTFWIDSPQPEHWVKE